jgi:antitoxin component YwqK of YwqJK toxin-antitoxin module
LEIRNYNKGKLHGKREYFDPNGQLIQTEYYEFGNKLNK